MSHFIKVTNKNDAEITDYFNGICYSFPCDEPVNVPLDAMRHIFGIEFPLDEKTLDSHVFREQIFASVSRRWGLNSHDQNQLKLNRKIINAIKFVPIITQQVELVAKADDMPAPREAEHPAVKNKEKSGKFKPRQDEEEGQASEEEVA